MIKSVIQSEKSVAAKDQNIYVFLVGLSDSKTSIAQEVHDKYKVDVVSVKTVTARGKLKRVGSTRRMVLRSAYKKAYVSIKKGQKIDLES